jgi:FeS assembly SUF system protein
MATKIDQIDDSGQQLPSGELPSTANLGPFQTLDLESNVIEAIRQCYDPEIPVNIYDLGLIYNVDVEPSGRVDVKMTLTSPMCPVAGTLPPEVEQRVREVDGVTDATVEVVWDPPWTPEMMSEAARLDLGFF